MNQQSLWELLKRYQPQDHQEQAFRQRMLQLWEQGDAACSRHNLQPGHFTASAFVLSPDQQQLALIAHPKLGRWLQPGGHLEAEDASIEEAACREVVEELGISALKLLGDGLFDVDIHPIPARPTEAAHEHFDLRVAFLAEEMVFQGELRAKWVPLLQVNTEESDASVLRAVQKLIRAKGGSTG